MLIRLKGKKNIYEEIVDDYTRYILSGALAEGEKLPSCRALATQLGINPNTVERAYAELERQGLIRTLPKKGAYVAYAGGGREALFEEAKHRIAALKGAGLTKEELFALAEKIYGNTEEINDRDQRT